MNRRNANNRLAPLAGLAALLALAPVGAAEQIDVPDDWPFIQQAIAFASNGDVIVVQQGDYPEHIDLLGKAITVRSTDPTNPDVVSLTRIVGPTTNVTVICENGEGPDTVLSGFTITHLSPAVAGRGMTIEGTSPTVSYCVFHDNLGGYGGGMSISSGGAPTISHCTFTNNEGTDGAGAILIGASGATVISDCTFLGNSTGGRGGAVRNNGSDVVTFSNCNFEGNTANWGGAVYNGEQATFTNCTFTNNQAITGGAIQNTGSANSPEATVQDCTFTNNAASIDGGAMYNSGTITLLGCDFVGNTCGENGGAMLNRSAEITIDDCTFAGDYNNLLIDSIGSYNWTLDAPALTPVGAACMDDFCIVSTEADCIDAGGIYMGDGTTCADITCPGPCIGDLDGDGLRDQADLGILLASYEIDAGGDLNGDCFTDQADLGLLLAGYDIPCP